MKYFVDHNGVIYTIDTDTKTVNHPCKQFTFSKCECGDVYIKILGKEHLMWDSLVELGAYREYGNNFPLNMLHKDLQNRFQWEEDLDWECFLRTAGRAFVRAEIEGRNNNGFGT